MVGGEYVLHRVKREGELSGRENVRKNISGGNMSGFRSRVDNIKIS